MNEDCTLQSAQFALSNSYVRVQYFEMFSLHLVEFSAALKSEQASAAFKAEDAGKSGRRRFMHFTVD